MNDQFLGFCCSGKLDDAKELYKNTKININSNSDYAFRLSCYCGHLNMAQWLYSLGGVNINVNDDQAFGWSCKNGHINVAQWLYSLGVININNEFIWSCHKGYLNIATWLYSLGSVDIHASDDFAFRQSCLCGIKWLLSIEKFKDDLVDEYLSPELYDYAFNLGYLPVNKMKTAYIEYKNKIKEELIEKNNNEQISIFEMDDLINIIMVYV